MMLLNSILIEDVPSSENVPNVDRLSILDSQGEENQLLGVLYMGGGTGDEMATTVMTPIKSLEDTVKALTALIRPYRTLDTQMVHLPFYRENNFLDVGIVFSNWSCRLLSLFFCDGPVAQIFYSSEDV